MHNIMLRLYNLQAQLISSALSFIPLPDFLLATNTMADIINNTDPRPVRPPLNRVRRCLAHSPFVDKILIDGRIRIAH